MNMKVINYVSIYEVNDKEVESINETSIEVSSHRLYDDRVVITTPNNEKYTVPVRQLKKAIDNASNT
jgi:hypothetical protein